MRKKDILNIFNDAKIVQIPDSVICDNFNNVDPITKLDLVNKITNQHFSQISELFFSMEDYLKLKVLILLLTLFTYF